MWPVSLYVYDISQGMASQFSRSLVGQHFEGIWHTAVVVYGNEYLYGSGISYDKPGCTPFGTPLKKMEMGSTSITQDIFHQFLEEISPRFSMATYNILSNNCNNFSNEVMQFLVGKTIPSYITDLPNDFLKTPMGQMILPMIQNISRVHASHEIGQHPPTQTPPPQNVSVTPQHPHTKLPLKIIGHCNPVAIQGGNIDAIKNKIQQNLEKCNIQLNSNELSTFSALCSLAVNNTSNPHTLPSGTFPFLDKLLTLRDEYLFPCLDLLRLLIIHPEICHHYINNSQVLLDLVRTYAKQTGVPKGARIMTLRLISNAFSTPKAATFFSTEPVLTLLIESITCVINSDDAQSRAAAAILLHNLSLKMSRNDSDATTQAVATVLHRLPQEEDPKTQYYLLVGLGHLGYCNDDAMGLCVMMEFDIAKWKNATGEVQQIANEIALLYT